MSTYQGRVYNQPCHQCTTELRMTGPHFHDVECGYPGCDTELPTPLHWCEHTGRADRENGVWVGLSMCEHCKGTHETGCWEWCHLTPFDPKQKVPVTDADRLRKRDVFRHHVWRKNADDIARNYGWTDEEIDNLIADL